MKPGDWLTLDLLILGMAAGVGAVRGAGVRALYPVAGTETATLSSLPGDFLFVVSNNLGVLLLALAGAFSWGLPGAFIVALNGFRIGVDSVSLLRADTAQWTLLMSYLPFEALGLCAAAAAGSVVSRDLFRCLFHGGPFSNILGAGRLMACALLLVVGAAALESLVKAMRTGLLGVLP